MRVAERDIESARGRERESESMKAMNQPAACDEFGENIKMLSIQ